MTGTPSDHPSARTPDPLAEGQTAPAPSQRADADRTGEPAAESRGSTAAPEEADSAAPGASEAAAPAPTAPEELAPAPAAPEEPAPTEEAASTEPEVRVADVVDRRTVRHAPRYGRFILVGVVLGAVVSLLLALLSSPSQFARSDLFWILFLALGLFGGIAGAVAAVVLDRRSLARRDARATERRTPPGA